MNGSEILENIVFLAVVVGAVAAVVSLVVFDVGVTLLIPLWLWVVMIAVVYPFARAS